MAQRMVQLASRQPGFLGVESARESLGITVARPVCRWVKPTKNYGTAKEYHWIFQLFRISLLALFWPCERQTLYNDVNYRHLTRRHLER